MAKTVLIVDDVAFVRKTLAEILREAGYSVVGEAADGKEAIEKWRELRPDVVTMDVVMPPSSSGVNALRTSGRFKMMVARPFAASYRTTGSDIDAPG